MSLFDKVMELLGNTRDQAENSAKEHVDQTSDSAKEATGGRFDEQADQGTDVIDNAADRIDGKED